MVFLTQIFSSEDMNTYFIAATSTIIFVNDYNISNAHNKCCPLKYLFASCFKADEDFKISQCLRANDLSTTMAIRKT